MYEIVVSKQNIDCVLVDEAQFLKKHHVIELTQIVDELEIPVMTFGLKNDFRNQLFEGSEYLLLYADKIEEMKTISRYQSYVPFETLLQWATLNGAMALGMEDKLGSLDKGKTPGVLVLDFDPEQGELFDAQVGVRRVV